MDDVISLGAGRRRALLSSAWKDWKTRATAFMRTPAGSLPYSALVGFGFFALAVAVAHLVVPRISEAQDTLFFLLLVLSSPALFLGLLKVRSGWLGWLLIPAVAYFLWLLPQEFSDGVKQLTPLLLKLPQAAKCSGRTLETLASLVSVLGIGISVALAVSVAAWGKSESGFSKSAAAILVFALLLLSDSDTPFFWVQHHWTAYALMGAVAWYGHQVMERSGQSEPPGRMVSFLASGFWLVMALTLSFLPTQRTPGATTYHWSYYLGPLEAHRAGGILLHDTPSQYGLLSILAPSWLPFSPVDSFYLALAALLAAQACVTYRALSSLAWFRGDKILPGAFTLLSVYLLPGFRGARGAEFIGAFEAPSSSAYRFFWAYALTLALLSPGFGKRRSSSLVAISALFAVGTLWSIESAFYCSAVLGAAWLGQLGTQLCRVSKPPDRSLGRELAWIGWPLFALIVAIGFVEGIYRLHYGLWPDWYAFVEYALQYQGGFGAIPIHYGGALNALLAILALSAGVIAYGISASDGQLGAGSFAVWGLFLSTFTYYISRSHPSNVCNLMGVWFPVFLVLADRVSENVDFRRRLQPFVLALAIVIVPLCIPHLPRFVEGLVGAIAKAHPPSVSAHIYEAWNELEANPSWDRTAVTTPTLDLTGSMPELIKPGLPVRPFYPVYPISEFAILRPERQRLYLERFLNRHPYETLQIWRGPKGENGTLSRAILPVIWRFYRRVSSEQGPDYRIEDYELRR